MNRNFFPLAIVMFLCACASRSEKKEVKNSLELLNGKTYGVGPGDTNVNSTRSRFNLPGVPIAGTQNQITRIRGILVLGEGLSAIPIKHTAVKLLNKDGEHVGDATSDINGAFVISGVLFNGQYTLSIVSKKYRGSLSVFVNSYEQDVILQARPIDL